MQIHISPNDGAPIYLQIVNQVKYLAASGRLTPGEQLPPVRKLAEQHRQALDVLAMNFDELEAARALAVERAVAIENDGSPRAAGRIRPTRPAP